MSWERWWESSGAEGPPGSSLSLLSSLSSRECRNPMPPPPGAEAGGAGPGSGERWCYALSCSRWLCHSLGLVRPSQGPQESLFPLLRGLWAFPSPPALPGTPASRIFLPRTPHLLYAFTVWISPQWFPAVSPEPGPVPGAS